MIVKIILSKFLGKSSTLALKHYKKTIVVNYNTSPDTEIKHTQSLYCLVCVDYAEKIKNLNYSHY